MGAPAPSTGRLFEARVVESEPVAGVIHRIALEVGELASLLRAGQFVNVAVRGEARQLTRIPLSFTQTDVAAGAIELVYEVVGPGTACLARTEVGSTLGVLGPLGNGWSIPDDARRVLLVSGGTGTVPIFAATLACVARGIATDVVVGARTKGLLWGTDALSSQVSGSVIVSTDDGSAGEKGFASGPALALLDERAYDLVLVCGPEPLMRVVSARAIDLGIPCQVSLERTMACGFGACSTCAVKTIHGMKGACMDGPVFPASEVVFS